LHFILTFSNETYGQATSFDSIKSHVYGGAVDEDIPGNELLLDHDAATEYTSPAGSSPSSTTYIADNGERASAAFVVLARNSDIKGIVPSIKQMEDRFNKKYKYPYVFLNDKEFDEKFKKYVSLCWIQSIILRLYVVASESSPMLRLSLVSSPRMIGPSLRGSTRHVLRQLASPWLRIRLSTAVRQQSALIVSIPLTRIRQRTLPQHVPLQLWSKQFFVFNSLTFTDMLYSSFTVMNS
jgi:hypothetical protein